jgi:hypothetical protein
MSVMGSPNAWLGLLEELLPEVLQLVVDTWHGIPGPLVSDKEDKTTEALCSALRKNRTLRELPFLVDTQWVELNPEPGQKQGRLDITFRPTGVAGSPNEEIYFCLECKRLNFLKGKKKVPGGSQYVKDGMLRFVNKQYAKAVKHGGMLGYVLDGNVPQAIKNVESNIRKQCVTLYMDSPGILHMSSILTQVSTARESFHQRKGEEITFRVHHLFLPADKLFE